MTTATDQDLHDLLDEVGDLASENLKLLGELGDLKRENEKLQDRIDELEETLEETVKIVRRVL